MDVRIETAGRENLALTRDYLGARADDNRHIRLDIGIAGFADRVNPSLFQSDVGFDDAPMVEDQRIGDHRVDRALPIGDLALPHAIADHLAAAELHLLAIGGEILLHLDDDVGVGKPNPIPGGRTEHGGIDVARNPVGHEISPFPLKRSSELAHDVLAKPVNRSLAGHRHQGDIALLARLEPHGRAGRDVEPHSASFLSIKLQGGVGFEEMIVRADLSRSVAAIDDRQGYGLAVGIDGDLALADKQFTGNHGLPPHAARIAMAARASVTAASNAASTAPCLPTTVPVAPAAAPSSTCTWLPTQLNTASARSTARSG